MNEEILHCENCGDEIEYSDLWYDDDGRMLCYDCYLDAQKDLIECDRCGESIAAEDAEYTDTGVLCHNCAEQEAHDEALWEEANEALETAIFNFEEIGYHPVDEIMCILAKKYPKYDFVNLAFNLRSWR